MVCSKGGFPQLRKLRLYFLTELEEWEIEEGSMPCLHDLYIEFCLKLKGDTGRVKVYFLFKESGNERGVAKEIRTRWGKLVQSPF